MTQLELFEKTREFLKAEEIDVEVDSKQSTFVFGMEGKDADVRCKLICEEEPLVIHALATIPVRVPQEANNRVLMGLNEFSRRCKLGSFMLDCEGRRVLFRVSLPFEGVVEVSEVIRLAMGVSLQTMDEAAQELMKLMFDASEEKSVDDFALPARGTSPLQAPDGQRPGFN